MVQVDLAWSYGVGGSFAMVAQRYLAQRDLQKLPAAFLSWPFLQFAFFATFIMIPATVQLIWSHPRLQFVYAVSAPVPLPLVIGAIMGVPAMGIIGFAINTVLLRGGHYHLAIVNFALGYFGLFFGISHGWDGTGYQRLFSTEFSQLADWSWANYQLWATSDIGQTFNLHMAVILPYLLYFASYWIKRDHPQDPGQWRVVGWLLLLVFVTIAGSAVVMTVALNKAGAILGGGIAIVLALVLVFPRKGILARFNRLLFPVVASE